MLFRSLAGTGHLCISTLHANNTAEAVERIVNLFPRDQHAQVFLDLSQYLRAILGQRLVRGQDGRRVAAVEVLLNTPHIQELIKQGDVIGIKEGLRTSTEPGMQSFDAALMALERGGKVALEEALSHADSRSDLRSEEHTSEVQSLA